MENRAANRYNSCELCESCDSCVLGLLGFLKKRRVKSHRIPQWHARGHRFKSVILHSRWSIVEQLSSTVSEAYNDVGCSSGLHANHFAITVSKSISNIPQGISNENTSHFVIRHFLFGVQYSSESKSESYLTVASGSYPVTRQSWLRSMGWPRGLVRQAVEDNCSTMAAETLRSLIDWQRFLG